MAGEQDDYDHMIAKKQDIPKLAKHGFGGTDDEIAANAAADTPLNRALDRIERRGGEDGAGAVSEDSGGEGS